MSHSFALALALFGTQFASTAAQAHPREGAQVCTLGMAAAGQPGTVICKDIRSGATTQRIPVGATMVGPGGTGGSLSRGRGEVLVTNLAGGALLFDESDGSLGHPTWLETGGEGSLSGAIGERGAYVVTPTRLLFFPRGHTVAVGSARLLVGDGSASQVALAGGHAYVAEKSGTLEAFALRGDGSLRGDAVLVSGIPAGTIVGITGVDDLMISPVAHLASDANRATIPVVSGATEIQQVATKEVAACWAGNDDGEVCITNPGSMTVSCGRVGPGGFTSYTSAAAAPAGESVFDVDVHHGIVGILGVHDGARVLMVYARSEDHSDFLTSLGEFAVGTPTATGALVLPPLER